MEIHNISNGNLQYLKWKFTIFQTGTGSLYFDLDFDFGQ